MIAIVLAAVALAAAQVPASTPTTLGGTSWQLVAFHGMDDTIVKPDDGSKYTLKFGKDGKVAVRIDCNRGSGTWKSPVPGQLELGAMALTRAMCAPGSMHDRLVQDWSRIRSYVLKERHLFLSLMADSGIYEYEPLSSANIEGGDWQVTAVDTGHQATATTLKASALSLKFSGGSVSGSSGCNRFHGPYSKNGGRLALGPMAVTRKACTGEGVMEQEQRFLSALAAVATFRIEGDVLVLRRADDSPLVEARKAK